MALLLQHRRLHPRRLARGFHHHPLGSHSPLRAAANLPGNLPNTDDLPLAGDLQISGPGTLEVLAARNLDLGTAAANATNTPPAPDPSPSLFTVEVIGYGGSDSEDDPEDARRRKAAALPP